MLKRNALRNRWNGWQLTAGVCIAASIGLVALALMLGQQGGQPGWTAVNEGVDHALASLEQQAGGSKGAANTGELRPSAPATGGVRGTAPADETSVLPQDRANDDVAGGTPASTKAVGGAAGLASEPALGATKEADMGTSGEGKVDINHADAEQLRGLPGIGPAKAKAIVAERERNGPFRSADDLLRVKGIGPKLLEKMKSFIVLVP